MSTDAARHELDRLITSSGESYAAISRLLGRNAAYVQQYIKRGSPSVLEDRDRRRIADYFGVEERILGPDSGSQRSELVRVPRLDVRASAGPGAATGAETAIGYLGFDRRWLRDIGRGRPEDLSIVRVRGDSMTPTLIEGDDVLVDRLNDRDGLRDGIYVLRRDDVLLVKRVALTPTANTLTISSDNPAYPTWRDCPLDTVTILGRVVWSGRRHR